MPHFRFDSDSWFARSICLRIGEFIKTAKQQYKQNGCQIQTFRVNPSDHTERSMLTKDGRLTTYDQQEIKRLARVCGFKVVIFRRYTYLLFQFDMKKIAQIENVEFTPKGVFAVAPYSATVTNTNLVGIQGLARIENIPDISRKGL